MRISVRITEVFCPVRTLNSIPHHLYQIWCQFIETLPESKGRSASLFSSVEIRQPFLETGSETRTGVFGISIYKAYLVPTLPFEPHPARSATTLPLTLQLES